MNTIKIEINETGWTVQCSQNGMNYVEKMEFSESVGGYTGVNGWDDVGAYKLPIHTSIIGIQDSIPLTIQALSNKIPRKLFIHSIAGRYKERMDHLFDKAREKGDADECIAIIEELESFNFDTQNENEELLKLQMEIISERIEE